VRAPIGSAPDLPRSKAAQLTPISILSRNGLMHASLLSIAASEREFLNEHRESEAQEHKLAAQDSRLQQNATIRPPKGCLGAVERN
jgi:hypothetical protein